MRFFAKVIFICNCCFILSVILRWVENANKQKGNFDGVIKLQPLESTIVILGYTAIIFNFIFNAIVLFFFLDVMGGMHAWRRLSLPVQKG